MVEQVVERLGAAVEESYVVGLTANQIKLRLEELFDLCPSEDR